MSKKNLENNIIVAAITTRNETEDTREKLICKTRVKVAKFIFIRLGHLNVEKDQLMKVQFTNLEDKINLMKAKETKK